MTQWTESGVPAERSPATFLVQRGALVDQTAAKTLEDRWLTFVRDAGSGSPSNATWNYIGGDVTDCLKTTATDLVWVGADWFDGTTVDADDTYAGTPLPVRNGAVSDVPATTGFGNQLYQTGSSGVWLNANGQGGLASTTHWWPVAAVADGGTNRFLCWHVENTSPVTPWGKLLDTHIVSVNVFGGYTSHVATGIGSLTDNFWGCGVFRGTTHTYIYGSQFLPDYDADEGDTGLIPNYGKGSDISDHHTLTRVARVANGSLLTVGSWSYWNGISWVSGVTNAVPMIDTAGQVIRGDVGVREVTTGLYMLAAKQLFNPYLNVYTSANPQGPWTPVASVLLPTQGSVIQGGSQVGQLTKILPSLAHPAGMPAEHSMVMVSRNLLGATASAADESVRRFAPQFAVVPWY